MYMSDFVRHFYLQYHSCKSMYELTYLNIKGMRVNMGIPNINFMLSNWILVIAKEEIGVFFLISKGCATIVLSV